MRVRMLVLIAAGAVALWVGPIAQADEITVEEQQFIYELNVARSDPAAFAAAYLTGTTADEVAAVEPRPPLAVVDTLSASSSFHSSEMATYDYFAHQSPVTGDWPNQVARDHGYPLSGWLSDNANNIESIAAGYTTPIAALTGLITSPSHRTHLLAEVDFFADHLAVGVGYALSPDWVYWTVHTGFDDSEDAYVTGVVFDDANANGHMDMGEGLGGVTVTDGTLETTTNAGGGWSLRSGAGTHSIIISGGAYPGSYENTVTIGSESVTLDVTSQESGSEPPPATSCAGVCESLALVTSGAEFMVLDGHDTFGPSTYFFGNPGDVPLTGDWNCDGVRTPAMYRSSNGFMYLRNQNTQGIADIEYFYGDPSDIPIAGDFDGDGCDTLAIFRPSEGRVFVKNTLGTGIADYDFYFGNPGDVPFVGDFDGDGVDTVGLYRQSTGFVYFRNANTSGAADFSFFYGDPGDRIVAGDWDGDGDDTVAVYRPSTGTVYLKLENSPGPADEVFSVGSYSHALVGVTFTDGVFEE